MTAQWDRARFYPVPELGGDAPSVTTVLSIIDKSGPLMHWAANQERDVLREAMLTVLTQPKVPSLDTIWSEVEKATKGVKAHQKASEKAAAIGTAAHAYIEWRTKHMLGKDAGPEPEIPEAAQIAVMAWEDWARAVHFMPVMAERVVYHRAHAYAGTLDTLAEVNGLLTVVDYKTGKAVYAEAYLQSIAYQEAVLDMGLADPKAGLVLRLPKTLADPTFEPVWVPEDTKLSDFVAALDLWRWHRRATGQKVGVLP